ncbi:hypothetical protein FRC10_006050 [Ceratobasidium sp. 414]|nr:hypothetical protein FRC10_006050 [Ceratobasidium sp. 414]
MHITQRWGPDSSAPASPHQFLSPTMEDLEDKDMLDVPDPTAGVAFHFYEVLKAKPLLYATRLTDPETFMEVHWIANIKCSQWEKNPYFELPWVG